MADRKYLGIQKITVNSVDETNVLDVDIRLVTLKYAEDLVEVKFTPGTISGIGFKPHPKCWLIKIVHDGQSDVWDNYIGDNAKGAVIPNFSVTFDIVEDAAAKVIEVWNAEASKCYIANRNELKVEDRVEENAGAIFVVCIGTFTPGYE